MTITDFNTYKPIEVTSASGNPTISRALCFKITSGDDSTTGTGEIVLDWTDISSQADIGVYDENNNLLDYYFESFDAIAETAVIWVYRAWVRDGSVQAKIAYGSGPSDQSVVASMVFDKESNLQAGYLFNETSGDALDVTSNNNDGTVYGATQGVDGIVGGAYGFDGTDDYIDCGDLTSFDFGANSFSVELWIKANDLSTEWNFIIGKSDYWSTNDYVIDLRYDSLGFHVDSTNNTGYQTTISTGVWYHVVGVYDYNTGTATLYVNAVNEGSHSVGQVNVSNSYTFGICACPDELKFYLDGLISDVRIISDICTQTEIQAKYAATKSSPDFFSQQAATVLTHSPTNATSSSATLNGTLESLEGNSSLDVYFEWGTDTNYGNTTPTQTITSVPTSFDADISSLSSFTTYHYRAVATDGSNYWYSDDVSFYTTDLIDVDETQSEFQDGTLTDVEADSGDYLRLADTDVLSFAGGDYVKTSFLGQNNPCSFAFWFLPNDNTRANLFANYANGSSDFVLEWGFTDNEFMLWDDSGGSNLYTSGNFNLGVWHHVVVRCDSDGNFEIVVDKNVAAGPTSGHGGLLDSGRGYWIAGRPDNDFYLQDGSIDDFRIYSKYLSDTDISNLCDGNDVTDSLIRHWPLNEGSGDIAYEATGNGSDADIYGASWDGVFVSSGNRIVQLDLSSLSTYSDSLIEWTATLNGQPLTIETRYSLDGGSTWSSWQTCTSGSAIPGLSSGTDVSSGLLECRQTLSTNDSSVTPQLESLKLFFAGITDIIIELPVIAVHNVASISSILFQVNCPTISSITNFTVSHVDVGFSIDIPIINSTNSFSITDIIGMDKFIDLPIISSQNTFKISTIGTSFSTLLPSIASQNLLTISGISHDISLNLPTIKTTNTFDISNVSCGIPIPVIRNENSFTVSGIEVVFVYDYDICTVDIDNVQSILGFARNQILKIINT